MPNYDGFKFCNLDDNIQGARAGQLLRWTKSMPLTYKIDGSWPIFSDADLARCVRLAFDGWEAVANLKFVRVTSGTADITIRQDRIDGPSGVLAEAQLPPGDNRPLWARFDSLDDWIISNNPPADKVDAIRVMRHEFGHNLGLGHIAGLNLMAAMYSRAISLPQVGDIAEMVARYGVKTIVPVDPPPTQPPTGSDYVLIKIPKDQVIFPD